MAPPPLSAGAVVPRPDIGTVIARG